MVAGALVPRNFSHHRLRHRKLGMGASSCSADGVATRMTLFRQPSGGLIVMSFGNIGTVSTVVATKLGGDEQGYLVGKKEMVKVRVVENYWSLIPVRHDPGFVATTVMTVARGTTLL